MTHRYPGFLPPEQKGFQWQELAETINRMFGVLVWISPILNPELGKVEPPAEYLRDNMLAMADGSDWNPGSGKGLYRYDTDTSSWVYIG